MVSDIDIDYKFKNMIYIVTTRYSEVTIRSNSISEAEIVMQQLLDAGWKIDEILVFKAEQLHIERKISFVINDI
jgi:hypothetical protein